MPANDSTETPITGSGSACGFRITGTSSSISHGGLVRDHLRELHGGGGRPLAVLDQILERYRVVQHGVSMYFGSAEPLNREHLTRLKKLVKRTKTPWLTDHLCWGSVDGRYTHDLLPCLTHSKRPN
jgi:uncharacterized protein (UPF0276 family)